VARAENNQGVKPSLLDRLIDPDSGGTAWRHGYGVEQMTATVLRDLDDLLNTRQSQGRLPEGYSELLRSVFSYGLPELTSFEGITDQQRAQIGQVIETVIALHEPRLRDVRATLVDAGDGKSGTLRFRIDSRLCLDPAPDVAFDTVLELTTGRYKVQPSGA
jgi:type VI secretion system protein ImpF